jgi:hypothetical protein
MRLILKLGIAGALILVLFRSWVFGGDFVSIADEIRLEALLPSNGEKGYPLPLASLWNTGQVSGGFDPNYQLDLIHKGHRILPTFFLPSPMQNQPPESYYKAAIIKAAGWNLPVVFVSTQWEHLLTDDIRYSSLPANINPNVVNNRGEIESRVSPFGPPEIWKKVGRRWTESNLLQQIQAWYPSPPLIIFLSNNEHKKLIGPEVEQSQRYLEKYGKGRSDIFKNKVLSDAWIERYGALFEGMSEGLFSSSWKENSKFVGYNAFQYCGFGRGQGWLRWSLYSPGRLNPWAEVWDGASLSFYVRPYNNSTDYTMYSPQIEAMNWVFMIKEVYRNKANFWLEISTWDGGEEQRSKYLKNGQKYSPERYSGMVQFGMWLLRPRVVREFRMWNDTVKNSGKYFVKIFVVVDKVYENEILKRFWRYGRLVANNKRQHPYNMNIPSEYKNTERWFLLDTSANVEIGQADDNRIDLFSLALEIGSEPSREWLIYAFSPLSAMDSVQILLPGYGNLRIKSKTEGSFYWLKENSKQIVEIK